MRGTRAKMIRSNALLAAQSMGIVLGMLPRAEYSPVQPTMRRKGSVVTVTFQLTPKCQRFWHQKAKRTYKEQFA